MLRCSVHFCATNCSGVGQILGCVGRNAFPEAATGQGYQGDHQPARVLIPQRENNKDKLALGILFGRVSHALHNVFSGALAAKADTSTVCHSKVPAQFFISILSGENDSQTTFLPFARVDVNRQGRVAAVPWLAQGQYLKRMCILEAFSDREWVVYSWYCMK